MPIAMSGGYIKLDDKMTCVYKEEAPITNLYKLPQVKQKPTIFM